jgi:hypothetical protein
MLRQIVRDVGGWLREESHHIGGDWGLAIAQANELLLAPETSKRSASLGLTAGRN